MACILHFTFLSSNLSCVWGPLMYQINSVFLLLLCLMSIWLLDQTKEPLNSRGKVFLLNNNKQSGRRYLRRTNNLLLALASTDRSCHLKGISPMLFSISACLCFLHSFCYRNLQISYFFGFWLSLLRNSLRTETISILFAVLSSVPSRVLHTE